MSEVIQREGRFYPLPNFSKRAHVGSMAEFRRIYERSLADPEGFWAEAAEAFFWKRNWTRVRNYNFNRKEGPIRIRWFEGGQTNISYNCLDRHLESRGDRPAIVWEGNEPGEDRMLTYQQLYEETVRFSAVLKGLGVKPGDRVVAFMPMIPELAITVLACARIGAIHCVVFSGFSAGALKDRIVDLGARVLVTSDGTLRRGKETPIKETAEAAIEAAAEEGVEVEKCVVVRRLGEKRLGGLSMKKDRDYWWDDLTAGVEDNIDPEWMDAESPLFIQYTSNTAGNPKGVVHTLGGYMVYTGLSYRYVFDFQEDDLIWCTSDLGWAIGHSYMLYGPLLNGARTLMFEGVPTHPDAGRFWDVVDKWGVSVFYTSPTTIRTIKRMGERYLERSKRQSLRLLGTVGEPIKPETWQWYYDVVGRKQCPVVDTWSQPEAGGILIAPLPGAVPIKPGSPTLPFFGIKPSIMDEEGHELEGNNVRGQLALKAPWPGQIRTLWRDSEAFEQLYFSDFDGFFFSGDGAVRDVDGYYWITGRVDDVIIVDGHRIGTAEIESALVGHPVVAEAAVVGIPHDTKGQGIYAFVTLKAGQEYNGELKDEIIHRVSSTVGPFAAPDVIHWAPELPKTRSGKILRRVLRKMASGDMDQIGDTTTLVDPNVVEVLKSTKDL